jgi:hypothetical protein
LAGICDPATVVGLVIGYESAVLGEACDHYAELSIVQSDGIED